LLTTARPSLTQQEAQQSVLSLEKKLLEKRVMKLESSLKAAEDVEKQLLEVGRLHVTEVNFSLPAITINTTTCDTLVNMQ
jgi:hypothetical protein